jgi:putative component of membrane protein insertase Oxa1/YidC/SpoIIIJ protein YidD
MTGRNYDGPWRRTPGRIAGLALVRLYQLTLSGLIGGHCRHLPTCSEYASEAIARHGLWRGAWLALWRQQGIVWWQVWRFRQGGG